MSDSTLATCIVSMVIKAGSGSVFWFQEAWIGDAQKCRHHLPWSLGDFQWSFPVKRVWVLQPFKALRDRLGLPTIWTFSVQSTMVDRSCCTHHRLQKLKVATLEPTNHTGKTVSHHGTRVTSVWRCPQCNADSSRPVLICSEGPWDSEGATLAMLSLGALLMGCAVAQQPGATVIDLPPEQVDPKCINSTGAVQKRSYGSTMEV